MMSKCNYVKTSSFNDAKYFYIKMPSFNDVKVVYMKFSVPAKINLKKSCALSGRGRTSSVL